MKKHSLKDWMIAVRPWSFPASSMPVVVTLAYLYWMQQDINWVNGIWAFTVAILHANNTRDMRTDARAEIQTLAMKLGGKASMYVYCAEVLFPFGWIAGLIAAGTLPLWTLLVMPALVPAIGNVRVVSRFPGKGESAIAGLDEMTAKLQLLFSLLFTLSFVVAGLLS